jgi:hypothetical protein
MGFCSTLGRADGNVRLDRVDPDGWGAAARPNDTPSAMVLFLLLAGEEQDVSTRTSLTSKESCR